MFAITKPIVGAVWFASESNVRWFIGASAVTCLNKSPFGQLNRSLA